MKLLAIHVSLPKFEKLGGKEYYTAINKQPVMGPISALPLGLEGNDVGNPKFHGGEDKAIYGYGHQHYAWWRQKYPDLKFPVGVFGENLIIEDWDEQMVCIGDQYQVGSALLEVSLPRIPCQTQADRMEDRLFVKKFIDACRCGTYFRVITPGNMQTGDSLVLHAKGKAGLTVAATYQLYTHQSTHQHWVDQSQAEPTLKNSWKEKILNKVAGTL